ncbi:MAG: hypothetical protein JOZ22_19740 [Acidobacteriia bacterium]|nr:hypothetical protein [Terriglobia bacterium]MBV9082685.1 hypothetical protein [Acidobacteriaceae bacterium]
MTMPETPAALWLRHVLDHEVEPLYLRMQQRAAAPSLSGLVLQQSALPFILLCVGLYAVAWFLVLY